MTPGFLTQELWEGLRIHRPDGDAASTEPVTNSEELLVKYL